MSFWYQFEVIPEDKPDDFPLRFEASGSDRVETLMKMDRWLTERGFDLMKRTYWMREDGGLEMEAMDTRHRIRFVLVGFPNDNVKQVVTNRIRHSGDLKI